MDKWFLLTGKRNPDMPKSFFTTGATRNELMDTFLERAPEAKEAIKMMVKWYYRRGNVITLTKRG